MTGPHAMVVGGTGMLAGACVGLARAGWVVSVVARSHAGLSDLARAHPRIRPAPADYFDEQAFAGALRARRIGDGPFSLGVAWVHTPWSRPLRVLADAIRGDRHATPLVHVVGCEWSGGGLDAPSSERPAGASLTHLGDGIEVRRVVLGWKHEGGATRWLTHEEIGAGVLAAALDKSGTAESTIGVTRPWSDRPR